MAKLIYRSIEKKDIEITKLDDKISSYSNDIKDIKKSINSISDTVTNVLFKEV